MFILLEIIRYRYGFSFLGKATNLALTLHNSLGLLIMWYAFARYQQVGTRDNINRFLKLIGRRSIDVYFLHYFILPYDMGFVGQFFLEYDMPFIEYCLALLIAIPMVLASLGLGQLLRLSPLASKLLLGAK